jgi:RNA polymerase sigma factor (sigma-70 family)
MDKQLESREFTEAYQSALEQAARVTKENGKDVSLAQDAVQETIVRLLLRKKKEKIRNWLGFLSTSVRRTVVKLIKRDEAALRPAVTPTTCSDLKSAEAIFSRILVNELERQLPERDLEIVRLSEFEGLDWKEIAMLKNISPEAARKRYYRSTRTIRRVLQSRMEEGKDGVAK